VKMSSTPYIAPLLSRLLYRLEESQETDTHGDVQPSRNVGVNMGHHF